MFTVNLVVGIFCCVLLMVIRWHTGTTVVVIFTEQTNLSLTRSQMTEHIAFVWVIRSVYLILCRQLWIMHLWPSSVFSSIVVPLITFEIHSQYSVLRITCSLLVIMPLNHFLSLYPSYPPVRGEESAVYVSFAPRSLPLCSRMCVWERPRSFSE